MDYQEFPTVKPLDDAVNALFAEIRRIERSFGGIEEIDRISAILDPLLVRRRFASLDSNAAEARLIKLQERHAPEAQIKEAKEKAKIARDKLTDALIALSSERKKNIKILSEYAAWCKKCEPMREEMRDLSEKADKEFNRVARLNTCRIDSQTYIRLMRG